MLINAGDGQSDQVLENQCKCKCIGFYIANLNRWNSGPRYTQARFGQICFWKLKLWSGRCDIGTILRKKKLNRCMLSKINELQKDSQDETILKSGFVGCVNMARTASSLMWVSAFSVFTICSCSDYIMQVAQHPWWLWRSLRCNTKWVMIKVVKI
jgi:hypothetical protein